jgi:hypothetical protein
MWFFVRKHFTNIVLRPAIADFGIWPLQCLSIRLK